MNIAWKTEYQDFVLASEKRMKRGEKEYANQSFSEEPLKLVNEIEEELLDVTNWAFILYCRMQQIKQALLNVDLEDDLVEMYGDEADFS